MGALALRERARSFLSGNTVETQLRAQIGKQDEQIAKLTDIVNGLLAEREPVKGRKAKENADG
jgi:hypothetical protein